MIVKYQLRILIVIFIIIQSINIHSEELKNPFWQNGVVHKPIPGINPFILTEPQFIADFSIPIDYADGIYFGAYYQFDSEIRFSRLFNFYATLKLGVNAPTLNSASISWVTYPIQYLKAFINYKIRNFSQYEIFEHNLSFGAEGFIDLKKMPRWFDCAILGGLNIRFIDMDIRSFNIKYRSDWFLEMFIIFRFKFMFHPVYLYSVGFSIGNYDDYVVYTANYWQFEIYNYFHIIKGVSIFCNAGFSLSGAFPFAGVINRGWGELGVRYAFKEI
jgi:hypothetical protein